MSLFQTLELAAGLGAPGEAAAPRGVLAAIIQMVQAQPGGVAGIIQHFEAAGLGGVAQSWLNAGANQPVEPAQVQTALGSGLIGQVASRLGVSNDQASSHLAEFLPLLVDHLSPNGQLPAEGSGAGLGGLLASLGLSDAR